MACFKFVVSLSDTASKYVFIVINAAVMLISVFGNSMVMYVILTRQRLHLPTFCLLFSLALSDLITALFGELTYATEVAFKNNTTSCTADKMIAFLHATSCSTSLMLLCMISRDRFLHVSKGLRYSDHTSIKQVVAISLICWFLGMSIALLFCFEERYMKILSTSGFAVIGLTCFTGICVINKRVHRLVQNHFEGMENAWQDDGAIHVIESTRQKQKKERAQVERSVNRSIYAVIIVYSISWFPVIVLMITFTFHNLYSKHINTDLRMAFAWASTMSYCNGAINPFIYAYRCDNIGRDIRRFLSGLKRKIFRVNSVSPTDPSHSANRYKRSLPGSLPTIDDRTSQITN